jgi:hypothetical protein
VFSVVVMVSSATVMVMRSPVVVVRGMTADVDG